jgi:CHAT domain-containing protein
MAGIYVTIYSDTAATEEAFKAMDGKSPRLLHLATHGFFLPVADKRTLGKDDINAGSTFTVQQNPMFRSGLVLANGNHTWKGETAIAGKEDGILTAYEIAQMDLSNTDLIVLSACETALGDLRGNEGVIGLQRAFKMAGVKQMIISLWQVPDKATRELMIMVYKNWLTGMSTREALRNAQLKMKQKYPPYYWAAFVLVE